MVRKSNFSGWRATRGEREWRSIREVIRPVGVGDVEGRKGSRIRQQYSKVKMKWERRAGKKEGIGL